MEQLINILRIMLLLLATVGGVISCVWLMILGQWWAVGYGLLIIPVPVLLSFAVIPGSYIARPSLAYMDRDQRILAFLCLLIGKLYEWAIFAAWFALVFYVLLSKTTTEDYLALLIWAYTLALAPWLYMAHKLRERETGGDSSRIYILSVHIAYVIVATVAITGWFAPVAFIATFWGITLLGTLTLVAITFLWFKRVSDSRLASAREAQPVSRSPR